MGSDDGWGSSPESPSPPPPPPDEHPSPSAWSTGFSRSRSVSPRSRPSSPRASPRSSPGPPSSPIRASRFSSAPSTGGPGAAWRALVTLLRSLRSLRHRHARPAQWGRRRSGAGRGWFTRRRRGFLMWAVVVAFFFVMNWWMFSRLQEASVRRRREPVTANATELTPTLGEQRNSVRDSKVHKLMFTRLLALAAHALAEADHRSEPRELWQEPLISSSWIPCADQHISETYNIGSLIQGNNGYIMISANGGINQQRIAICNAVAIARLLNSTLVVPNFLYSSVWRDKSQFSDIYQEDHFINYLKPDVRILKELPVELRSLDLEAIGSLVTDTEVMKEAKPSFYVKKILPILLRNRVVHLTGFGNRLAFDPIPFELQRLRCRCNFHALQFVEKIQETGALLVQRMHHHHTLHLGPLINNLLGPFGAKSNMSKGKNLPAKVSRYLAVHLRFEIDMAAYSMCYFGGGKEEEEELEAYRAAHFPALTLLKKTKKIPSAASLRSEGRCPLAPEETVLMLAALGFKRKTNIYVAGANIYGGKSRMAAFKSLYPNLATKESLLSSSEIEPFLNYSSQLAALDFIVCAAADAFAISDPGSQFSSLISGFRMYYGGGLFPTIRPNKRRLASILAKNKTIEWKEFEERVRKASKESKVVQERPIARSVYRHPRCPECMCRVE